MVPTGCQLRLYSYNVMVPKLHEALPTEIVLMENTGQSGHWVHSYGVMPPNLFASALVWVPREAEGGSWLPIDSLVATGHHSSVCKLHAPNPR